MATVMTILAIESCRTNFLWKEGLVLLHESAVKSVPVSEKTGNFRRQASLRGSQREIRDSDSCEERHTRRGSDALIG